MQHTQPSAPPVSTPQYDSLFDLTTPVSGVSAFCQAVLSKIVPNEFWGEGLVQDHNRTCFLKYVHKFIHLRRFESMRLHEVMQGMKVSHTAR
jgi:telomerase reverse transcriptase